VPFLGLFVGGWALVLCAGHAIASSARDREPSVAVLGAVEERSTVSDHSQVPVVRVRVHSCDRVATGSGVLLDGNRVLTARHVVDGATAVSIDLPSGATATARVDAYDSAGRDAAVVRLAVPSAAAPVAIASRPVVAGEAVSVLGHPQGGATVQRDGAVVAVVDHGALALDGGRVMTVDVGFEPGVSGGPVVDGAGRLVGLAIGVERNSGTGIAVPIDAIGALLEGRGEAPAASCRTPG
jgi:serine protease Do